MRFEGNSSFKHSLERCEVSARRLTCSESLRERRIRLGPLRLFLFQQLIALIKWC